MTTTPGKMTAPLSAVEVEQLRDIRSRLNRVPKGSLGDKSVGPLSKGFFDICARVGLTPERGASGPVDEADMADLRRKVGGLQAIRQADPAAYRKVFDAGVLQAIATRRLILGGAERPSETP